MPSMLLSATPLLSMPADISLISLMLMPRLPTLSPLPLLHYLRDTLLR